MTDIQQILSLVFGSAVFGGVISTLVAHYFTTRREREQRLFDARRVIYAQLANKITGLNSDELLDVQKLMGEASLLCGHSLNKIIEKLSTDIEEIKKLVKKGELAKAQDMAEKLELKKYVQGLRYEMKKELEQK